MTYLHFGGRCLLALVFAASAVSKLRGPSAFQAFRRGITAMRILPDRAIPPVAVVVAGLEAVVPVTLLIPYAELVGLALAIVLLAAFTLGIALTLRRGTVAVCPCFGVSGSPFGWRHIARNSALLAVGASAAFATRTDGLPAPPGMAIAVVVAAVLAVLAISFDDLTDVLLGPVRKDAR
ncbi:hypothetical protein ODJ79_46075 [Actinoplanes sp. KI2]|uniref:MauE/DoxX family redox-associated membrane protein n=1 Tax=Actinoplanes sp. KI2 TaxID=2983315 RepID=UPI0021D577FC|nr:MauE/DoxX family redox-associated membrane protein [Actinoplanes sp. KI2]MCU7731125.1 hypothetical protein [Actinoplanes sp. KI2]